MTLASAGQEEVSMRLLTELCGSSAELTVYEDNQSAIVMAKNPQFHGRTNIKIKYHFIQELARSSA